VEQKKSERHAEEIFDTPKAEVLRYFTPTWSHAHTTSSQSVLDWRPRADGRCFQLISGR